MSSVDVLVIGAGPAGSAAAVTCRKAGLDVMVITDRGEKSTDRYAPAPLESIHPGVSSLLQKINLGGVEAEATRAFYSGIYAGGKYTALGEDASGVWRGMHINRKIFDEDLVQRVGRSDIPVLFDQKVNDITREKESVSGVRTNAGEYFAKYIIDASGKKGWAGNKLKWKSRFYSPPLLCWTGVSECDDSFTLDPHAAHFIPSEHGWTWLAPQPPDYCAWTRLSVRGEKSLLAPEELKQYKTVENINVANMRWRLYRPVCSEGILLCGDAAGVLDPAAGQGILNALWSGIRAAETVVSCLQQPLLAGFHLATYDDWFVSQFEMKVKKLMAYYEEWNIDLSR